MQQRHTDIGQKSAMSDNPFQINALAVEPGTFSVLHRRGTSPDEGAFTAVHNRICPQPALRLTEPARHGLSSAVAGLVRHVPEPELRRRARNPGKPMLWKEKPAYPHVLWITLCM